jgi:hypothetical protein
LKVTNLKLIFLFLFIREEGIGDSIFVTISVFLPYFVFRTPGKFTVLLSGYKKIDKFNVFNFNG